MSFLGRILVVLIFIMSVIFMTLAAVVYGTHRNWEDYAKQVEADLAEERTKFGALQDSYNRLDGELRRQIDAALQDVTKLEQERSRLAANEASLIVQVDELTAENRKQTARMAVVEQNNADVTAKNDNLRGEIRKTQGQIDVAFASALTATEKAHQLQGEVEVLGERTSDLTQEAARMTAVLRENGIAPGTPADAVKPSVNGFVSAITRRGSTQYVEVTIGADDGLQVGHTIEVFRNSKYLGRVTILKTSPDRAVGQVEKNFQEGRIQEGDRVATRLRLS